MLPVSLTVFPVCPPIITFQKSQCWINLTGPILDQCSSTAWENQAHLKIDATVYTKCPKSMSLDRVQPYFCFLRWLPPMYSRVVLQLFYMFFEPLTQCERKGNDSVQYIFLQAEFLHEGLQRIVWLTSHSWKSAGICRNLGPFIPFIGESFCQHLLFFKH